MSFQSFFFVILILSILCLISFPNHVESLANGLGRTPQMGWNEYNHYHNKINETIVRATAQRMVDLGLHTLGYKYVNLDDCWQIDRDNTTHKIIVDPSQFPSGIAPLVEYVHSLDLLFGLYSDAGTKTCEGRPGSLTYETYDAQTYADWGVDYLKYDNCNSQGIDPKKRYPIMRDALNATGRRIFFGMCEWGDEDPATWAPEVGNSWRTTGDISDSWKSMINLAHENDKWWMYAGPGGWNDPDMLEIETHNGMTQMEQQTHFSLWSIMKSPLILGMDVLNISAEALRIVTNVEVIEINQDLLGVQGHRVSNTTGDGEIWSGPLLNGDIAVLLVNIGNSTMNVTATWSQLGLKPDATVFVRDIIRHTDVGNATGSISRYLESHDSAFLRFRFMSKEGKYYVE